MECKYSHVTTADVANENDRDEMRWVTRAYTRQILGQHMDNIDQRSLRVVVFAEASVVNNTDLITHVGYLLLLKHDTARESPIYYYFYKSHRFLRSVLSSALYSPSDVGDMAVLLRLD